jgi:hypothetical protein
MIILTRVSSNLTNKPTIMQHVVVSSQWLVSSCRWWLGMSAEAEESPLFEAV